MPKRSLRWCVGRSLDAAIWRPSHAAYLRDQLVHLRRNDHAAYTDQDHLVAAAEWLVRAQDATRDGGVSGRYSLRTGWSSSYPETTGYIIPTFLSLATALDTKFHDRARQCVEFLKAIQLSDGAFPGGELSENRTAPSVFNTAQILHGLVAWHAKTGDTAAADAATRAANWLVSRQDADGAWRTEIYNGVTTYTSHASCWLAEAGKAFGEVGWMRAAERHLDWVLTHVDAETGWIDKAGFGEEDHRKRRAVTHTLAYTIWGILDLACSVGREDGIGIARRAATQVARRLELSGWLPGELNNEWKPSRSDYACLTGNAQMSLIWFRLAAIDGDPRFISSAMKALDLVKAQQNMKSNDPGICGGIPGSAPVWGDYIYMSLPNWAAKYFIDALLAQKRALAGVTERPTPSWRVPDDVPRLPSLPSSSNIPSVKVVMLTRPDSHKVPQMMRAWSRWGFRPAAVVIECVPKVSLLTRLQRRIQADGFVESLRDAIRKRLPTTDNATDAGVASTDVEQFCITEGIPTVRVGPLALPASVAAVRRLDPGVLIHAGAGILRRDLLAVPALGVLNVHMGLLPRYRGMNVAEWAHLEGNSVGCTVHVVDAGIDTGDILAVQEVETAAARSVAALRDTVDRSQIDLLGEVVRSVVATGRLPRRRPQASKEGRQYFAMHPALKALLERNLREAQTSIAGVPALIHDASKFTAIMTSA